MAPVAGHRVKKNFIYVFHVSYWNNPGREVSVIERIHDDPPTELLVSKQKLITIDFAFIIIIDV